MYVHILISDCCILLLGVDECKSDVKTVGTERIETNFFRKKFVSFLCLVI